MTPETRAKESRFAHIEISAFPPRAHMRGGLRIEWGTVDVVFGELVVYRDGNGRMSSYNDATSREFILALLTELERDADTDVVDPSDVEPRTTGA